MAGIIDLFTPQRNAQLEANRLNSERSRLLMESLMDAMNKNRVLEQNESQFRRTYDQTERANADSRKTNTLRLLGDPNFRQEVMRTGNIDAMASVAELAGIPIDRDLLTQEMAKIKTEMVAERQKADFEVRSGNSLSSLTGGTGQAGDSSPLQFPSDEMGLAQMDASHAYAAGRELSPGTQGRLQDLTTIERHGGTMEGLKSGDALGQGVAMGLGGMEREAERLRREQSHSEFLAGLQARKEELKMQESNAIGAQLKQDAIAYQKYNSDLMRWGEKYGGNITKIIADSMTSNEQNANLDKLLSAFPVEEQRAVRNVINEMRSIHERSILNAGELFTRNELSEPRAKSMVIGGVPKANDPRWLIAIGRQPAAQPAPPPSPAPKPVKDPYIEALERAARERAEREKNAKDKRGIPINMPSTESMVNDIRSAFDFLKTK